MDKESAVVKGKPAPLSGDLAKEMKKRERKKRKKQNEEKRKEKKEKKKNRGQWTACNVYHMMAAMVVFQAGFERSGFISRIGLPATSSFS
ncbi:hypothetical protein BSKO_07364 [Bryopsis sp. KO-2023]|nr:hypothetical protein BSKO_07364 [Bryopsis sp. KO-2023]